MFQACEDIGDFGKCIERQVEVHQPIAQAGLFDRQRLQGEVERIGGDLPEIRVPALERPQPGILQLLVPPERGQLVEYRTREAAGTIVIDTANTYLYFVLGNGQAIRYGIGVGREGFTWSGVKTIERKAEWPDWTPPPQMIQRQPYLPRFVAGGPSNPLGARAMYLSDSVYRIHGTNDPSTIGGNVSSGCIRLTNEDVIDLYNRVHAGTKVVVLPMTGRRASAGAASVN